MASFSWAQPGMICGILLAVYLLIGLTGGIIYRLRRKEKEEIGFFLACALFWPAFALLLLNDLLEKKI